MSIVTTVTEGAPDEITVTSSNDHGAMGEIVIREVPDPNFPSGRQPHWELHVPAGATIKTHPY